MRTYALPRLTVYVLCFIVSTATQLPAQRVRAIPSEIENLETRVSHVILAAEEHYKKGKEWLKTKQVGKARQEFNRAVDSILESRLDVRSKPKATDLLS